MAGQTQPAIVNEDDDLTTVGNTEPAQVTRPSSTPAIAVDDDDFQIVEVDETGKQLGHEAEAPLTEEAGGERSYVDRQQAEQPGEPRSRNRVRRERQRTFAKQNQQENAALKAEIAELRNGYAVMAQRLGTVVEPRLTQLDRQMLNDQQATVNSKIERAEADYQAAVREMSQAMTSQDHEALQAALQKRDDAVLARGELKARKGQLDEIAARSTTQADTRQVTQQRTQTRQVEDPGVPLDAAGKQFASEFMSGLDWFDAKAGTKDNDSRILQSLDAAVLADGFDPNSRDYWEELEARAQEYLPKYFGDGTPAAAATQPAARKAPVRSNVTPLRRGPAVGGGAEQPARQLGKNQVVISPERKQAMIDRGILNHDGTTNDKAKFNRALKYYAEYDRTNASSSAR